MFAHDAELRRRFAYLVAGPAFGLSWMVGFVLLAYRRYAVLSTWVIASIVLSLVSMHFALYAAGRTQRTSALTRTGALLPLAIIVALMTWRPA